MKQQVYGLPKAYGEQLMDVYKHFHQYVNLYHGVKFKLYQIVDLLNLGYKEVYLKKFLLYV